MAENQKLNITIRLKDEISKGSKNAQKALNNIKDKVFTLLNPLGLLTAGVALLGATIVKGLSTWSQLEDRMINVGNLTNSSREEIDEMTKSLIATKENQGLTQDLNGLSEALFDVVSAGVPASESLEFLAVASKLATAGVTTTSVSVDGLTSVMNAYNMEASDAEGIAGKFFAAQQKGSTTIEQLASSVGKVAPLTASMNISFAETVSAMSAITLSGIKTAEATTGLRAAISNVIKPAKAATDTAEALGLEFNATALKSKGLAGFLKDVQEKTGGNTDAMAALFGSVEALNTVLAISANNFKNLEEVQDGVSNSAEGLEKANKIAMSSMSNQWKLFKGHLSSALVLFITPLAKATTFALKTMNSFFTKSRKLFSQTAEKLEKRNKQLEEQITEQQKRHRLFRNNELIRSNRKQIAKNKEKLAKLTKQEETQTTRIVSEEEKRLNAILESKNKEVAKILEALNTEDEADKGQKLNLFNRFKNWKLEEESIRDVSHQDSISKLEELLAAENISKDDRESLQKELYIVKAKLRKDDEKAEDESYARRRAAIEKIGDDFKQNIIDQFKAGELAAIDLDKALETTFDNLKVRLLDEVIQTGIDTLLDFVKSDVKEDTSETGWGGEVGRGLADIAGSFVEEIPFVGKGIAKIGKFFSDLLKFDSGGVVGGSSFTGDKIPVRVNSGEMILNKGQQQNLFSMLNSNNLKAASISNMGGASSGNSGSGGSSDLKVILNVDGVKLADGVVKNYNRARQLNLITTLKD